MPKYEIMLILDPKAEESKTKNMVESVFSKKIEKFEKLDKTELAYKINNSTTAKYFLLNVDSEPGNISEFVRKANLSKDIWRFLTINLDEEKGNKELKPRKSFDKRTFYNNRNRREAFSRPRENRFEKKTNSDKVSPKEQVTRKQETEEVK